MKKSCVRVCLAPGPWQLMMLAAALRQEQEHTLHESEDILVLYSHWPTSGEFRAVTKEIAEHVWPWKKIVFMHDIWDCITSLDEPRKYSGVVKNTRDKIGIEKADEMWTIQSMGAPEHLTAAIFDDSQIKFYEDGLLSYVPIAVEERTPLSILHPPLPFELSSYKGSLLLVPIKFLNRYRVFLKTRRRARHASGDIYTVLEAMANSGTWRPKQLSRMSKSYLSMQLSLPASHNSPDISVVEIEKQKIRDTLSLCEPLAKINLLSIEVGTKPRVLFLGQNLSRLAILKRDEEMDIYVRATRLLLDKGYEVVWKDHPRDETKAYATIQRHVKSRSFVHLQISSVLPVEIVAPSLHLAACVSGYSSSLFYLRELFDVKTYTFLDEEIVNRFHNQEHIFMCRHTMDTVSSLDRLPDAEP